jgi:SLT domain-containing protein
MVGQPASLAGATLRRLQQESGGNPRAQNNSDINARRGTPSKGLMQVIDPTFRAYAMPGHNDIWNPLDNILASMRYAMSRYGSLSAAYNRAGGYATGGSTPAGEPFWVGEDGPELMWSNRSKYVSTARQSREMSGSAGVGGGGTITVAPPVVKVFLDGQEWRGIARVEAEGVVVEAFTGATTRGRNNP